MSEADEKAAARDATNWAKKISTLNVAEVPEGAININVEGKRLASPIQGFRIGASSAVTLGAFSALAIAPCTR